MAIEQSTAEQRAQLEQEQLSRRGMLLLTGGLTGEGDAFVIGVGAVFVVIALYPLIEGWSLLSFPVVFAIAVLAGSRARRRRGR
jgi:hypothetical protein